MRLRRPSDSNTKQKERYKHPLKIPKILGFICLLFFTQGIQAKSTACDNITNGGEIGNNEVHCGPFTASTIVSLSDPSGGSGNVEYLWMTTTDPNLPIENWTPINGATSATLEPGFISATTYFLRCSRREGCSSWDGESNKVAMIINSSTVSCSENTTEISMVGNAISIANNAGASFSSKETKLATNIEL